MLLVLFLLFFLSVGRVIAVPPLRLALAAAAVALRLLPLPLPLLFLLLRDGRRKMGHVHEGDGAVMLQSAASVISSYKNISISPSSFNVL